MQMYTYRRLKIQIESLSQSWHFLAKSFLKANEFSSLYNSIKSVNLSKKHRRAATLRHIPSFPLISSTAFEWSVTSVVSCVSSFLGRLLAGLSGLFSLELGGASGLSAHTFVGSVLCSSFAFKPSSFDVDWPSPERRSFERRRLPFSLGFRRISVLDLPSFRDDPRRAFVQYWSHVSITLNHCKIQTNIKQTLKNERKSTTIKNPHQSVVCLMKSRWKRRSIFAPCRSKRCNAFRISLRVLDRWSVILVWSTSSDVIALSGPTLAILRRCYQL